MLPEIYKVVAIGRGSLSVMARPRAGEWLDDEIRGLSQAGITCVASLLTTAEAVELELTDEAAVCAVYRIRFLSLPITDRGVPDNVTVTADFIADLHQSAYGGDSIVIHCRAGIGRSGLIAAGVLLNEGLSPEAAFSLISKVRRVTVPDTEEQIKWLQHHRQRLMYVQK